MLFRWRVNIFLISILLAWGLVFYRLFYLSYLQQAFFIKTAETQYENQKEILAKRGNIYVRDLTTKEKDLVATQKTYPFIYVIPKETIDVSLAAQKLNEIFGISMEQASKLFEKKDDPFEVVERYPSEAQLSAVRGLNIKEISIGYEERRIYPAGSFLSQALGFLGFSGDDRIGQYGIESFYDNRLSGDSYADASFFGKKNNLQQTANRGDDIILTIDKNIQLFAEQELSYLMKKWGSVSGSIIIQNPQDGSILAMAGSPSFDPNNYGQYRLENFTNKSVQEMFEPGSSFKPITLSAALDQKKVTPETTYFDSGEVDVAGYKIKNFNEKSFGTQTMNQVLEKSLNTGAIFAEEKLGDKNFLNYAVNFGFGQTTGIDLAGESSGDISNLYSGRKINFITASFGQGIAVTPIQLVNAYSALANGGRLYRPFIVQELVKPNGEVIKTEPELIGTPISEKTSSQIKAMLVKVVENGFDKARVKGYDVAGKTGTAQIASKEGGYSEEFVHDIVGFAPAFDPKFVVLIKLEKPKGIKFASDSLSPSLGKIVKFLLNYFQIPPTRQ
ncbi:MAG: penicillin-binding protein 2 [Candidatus Yanofskybacteria bacterium]|nr:penicillin-binding protein 2 [Candidatus Yanofskybacteria bacterium]